jgi:hypothetical protein
VCLPGNNFLNGTPTAQEIREKNIGKQNYIKLKSFCTTKETFNGVKRQPTGWEKIFASY